MSGWNNRIIGEGEEAPDQLLANPLNFRTHPKNQQDSLAGVLDEVGWVQRVIVNKRTGHMIDGHLRVELALRRNEPTIPVVYVDLAPDEEAKILATFDPLGAMATTDAAKLDELLREVSTGSEALQEMLAELAKDNGLYDVGEAGMPELGSGEKEPFQQMTFTVADEQAEIIKEAMAAAKGAGPFVNTGNENSNGNALARIAEAYIGTR